MNQALSHNNVGGYATKPVAELLPVMMWDMFNMKTYLQHTISWLRKDNWLWAKQVK